MLHAQKQLAETDDEDDEFRHLEKDLKKLGLLQKKRRKVGSLDQQTTEGLVKEFPIDNSISYNLLSDLLKED